MTGNLKLLEEGRRAVPHPPAARGQGAWWGPSTTRSSSFPATFTNDRDQLIAALKELDFGNPTRLYDAVAASIERLKNIEGRRVVLVFTDGDDTGSRAAAEACSSARAREEVMIYAVGLTQRLLQRRQRQVRSKPDSGLRRLAEETGGGYFELEKTSDLAPTFTRVAQELHSQYVLGFTPAVLDGKVHRLTVRSKRPGMTVRARRSYVASQQQLKLMPLSSHLSKT